jgi:hypothetical protein
LPALSTLVFLAAPGLLPDENIAATGQPFGLPVVGATTPAQLRSLFPGLSDGASSATPIIPPAGAATTSSPPNAGDEKPDNDHDGFFAWLGASSSGDEDAWRIL